MAHTPHLSNDGPSIMMTTRTPNGFKEKCSANVEWCACASVCVCVCACISLLMRETKQESGYHQITDPLAVHVWTHVFQ